MGQIYYWRNNDAYSSTVGWGSTTTTVDEQFPQDVTATLTPAFSKTTFDKVLATGTDHQLQNGTGADEDSTFTIPNLDTSIYLRLWSDVRNPGLAGNVTGNFTLSTFNVTTADANITMRWRLHRTDNTGATQTQSAWTAGQAITATGVYTFTWTSLSLGTFAATDRFMAEMEFANVDEHGGDETIITDWGTYHMFTDTAGNTLQDSTHAYGYIQTPFRNKYAIST